MNPTLVNVFLVIIIAVIVGVASLYIYKSKKAGAACIGCPHAKECASKKKCNSQNGSGSCCR